MYYVRSLEKWTEIDEWTQLEDAEVDVAEKSSWRDSEAIGLFEGDDFESSELIAIGFEGVLFTK